MITKLEQIKEEIEIEHHLSNDDQSPDPTDMNED